MEGNPIPLWGWLLTIVMIPVWIAFAAGIFNLVLWLTRGLWHGATRKKTPLDSLQSDYSRGEITREQFEQRKSTLK